VRGLGALALLGFAAGFRSGRGGGSADIPLVSWPGMPLTLWREPTVTKLDVRKLRAKLARIARSDEDTLLLRLDGVEAARQPGVVWKAYLTPPRHGLLLPRGPSFIGNVALFGPGLRDEPHFKPASFSFGADAAVAAALATGANELALTLVPTGPIIDGKPSPPRPAARVKVAAVRFMVHQRYSR
jgi:hypothetical protein